MKGMKIMFFVMLLSLGVAGLWERVPIIKSVVHSALDPTLGVLLSWHTTLGIILITAIITLITTLLQKYMTDQDTLKTIKEELKLVQQEMKLAKDSPEKTTELSKKSFELSMKTMPLTMRPLIYTAVPFVLLIRWFSDYFAVYPVKIFGFMSWLWAYILFSFVLTSIFRKILKVH